MRIGTVLRNELVNHVCQVNFSPRLQRREAHCEQKWLECDRGLARWLEGNLEACEMELAPNLFSYGGRTVAKKAAKKAAAPKKAAAKKSAKKAAKKK